MKLNLKFFSIILNIILILALWYFYIKLKNKVNNKDEQSKIRYLMLKLQYWVQGKMLQ